MLIQTLVRFDINCAEFGKNRTTCVVVIYLFRHKLFPQSVSKGLEEAWHARNHPNGARFKPVLQPSRFERQLCLYYMKIMLRPRPPRGSTSEPEGAPWQ